jgi:hypothetical protein
MTFVIRALPAIVMEFRMGEKGYEENDHRRIAHFNDGIADLLHQASQVLWQDFERRNNK